MIQQQEVTAELLLDRLAKRDTFANCQECGEQAKEQNLVATEAGYRFCTECFVGLSVVGAMMQFSDHEDYELI